MSWARCRGLSGGLSRRGACGSGEPERLIHFWCGGRSTVPRPADHTPSGRLMPPSVRGVCLISSSCLESLTAATGSNLAGRRLQECALRTVLSHRAPRGRRWPFGATPSIMRFQMVRFSQINCVSSDTGRRDTGLSLWPGPSPCTARPRGGGRRPKAGRWGSFEGWSCATPPCEERGAKHDATSTSSRR